MITKTCKVCREKFTIPTVRKGGFGRVAFCSKACVKADHNHRAKMWARKNQKRINSGYCAYCGAKIIGRLRRFCDWSHAGLWREGGKRPIDKKNT